MDPTLSLAIRTVDLVLSSARQHGREGEYPTAAVEFAQAAMTLGMQIGHFRSTLGAQYPSSPEAAAVGECAARLNAAIVDGFQRVVAYEEGPGEWEEVVDEPGVPVPASAPTPYGYSPQAHEEE
jgi:hypothetical protein